MKVNNQFNPQIAHQAMPSGKNWMTAVGEGAVVFAKDRYANAIKELELYTAKAKTHDDRLLAEKIQRQSKTKTPDGESFLTAAGAKGSFMIDRVAAKPSRGGRRIKRTRGRKRATQPKTTREANTARFNPSAFGVPSTTRTVWIDGNPVEIKIGG
ncbi:MAG: hypothetical protein HF962_00485 [Sulfurovum sp.]|nr:hypothetical protein [Sulfurovum sp.]